MHRRTWHIARAFHQRRFPPAQFRRIATRTPQVQSLIRKFDTAVWSLQTSDVRECYSQIRARAIGEDGEPPPPSGTSLLSIDQIYDTLLLLASSAQPSDLRLMNLIMSDMTPLFSLPVDQNTIACVLKGFCQKGHFRQAHWWLKQSHRDDSRLPASIQQWHTLLSRCSDAGDVATMRSVLRGMVSVGYTPANFAYRMLVRTMMPSKPSVEEMTTVLDEMKKNGLKHDPLTLSALYDGYVDVDLPSRAIEMEQIYRSYFPDALEFLRHKNDPQYHSRQQVISDAVFSAMLSDLRKLPPGVTIQEDWAISAGGQGWLNLIRHAISKSLFDEAVQLYNHSKRHGVVPDAAMVNSLIRSIHATKVKAKWQSLSDSALTAVFALFQDLVDSHPIADPPSPGGPDAAMYTTLLRALVASRKPHTHFEFAVNVFNDMRAREIPLDSSILAQLIALFMRIASDAQDAFDVYRAMRTVKGTTLDDRGYRDVLAAFARLSYGADQNTRLPPSISHYFEIVQDMMDAGHEITPRVYSFVVGRIAELAGRNRKPARTESDVLVLGALRDALRRTHQHLTLDASVTPDAVLLNQLMDAYQRVDNLQEAYEVWERMYVAGMCDNMSVSIILDACGFANHARLAMSIWAQLQDIKFPLNTGNWNAYIECLCRTGWLDEALDVLCLHMGKVDIEKGSASIRPNQASAEMVLKFALSAGRSEEANLVLSRIYQNYGQCYPTK